MPKFMLILHSVPHVWRDVSPQEMQQKQAKVAEWLAPIHGGGRHVSGEKLGTEGGKLLNRQHGHVSVTDGPYAEAKEVVAGYMVIRAANYDEAVELTRNCPLLEDHRIEIRQTDPMGCGGD